MERYTLGFVICRNYYKELSIVLDEVNNPNIKVLCLQTTCLNASSIDKKGVNKQIESFKKTVGYMEVLIPDSCSGCGEDCKTNNLGNWNCPSFCIELFSPRPLINQLVKEGYLITTPGWIINWKDIVYNKWKFEEKSAKQFFNDTVKQICILDTGVYKNYSNHLEDFKQAIGLDIKILDIGLDYFRYRIEKTINTWQNKNEITTEKKKVKEAEKKIADYTMALDILKNLSNQSSEKALVKNIFQLFTILFSPQKMSYMPVGSNDIENIEANMLQNFQENEESGISDYPNFELMKSNNGFKVNALYDNEVLGYFEIEDVLFAEHIDSYTALTNSICSVLGILIYNSRQYGKVLKEKIEILEKSEHNLKIKNDELQTLYMDLQASEEEIRSSNEELRATADELQEMNSKLDTAKKKAEESDRLKTAFLHNMSHEIRTPLNAILGFSSILEQNFHDLGKLKNFSEIINHRGKDLLEIINGIIDIARIESNQMTVNYSNCNLKLLLSEIDAFFIEYQKQIKKQDVLFSMSDWFKNTDIQIVTDEVKLKQIFINLINNAFKFTKVGKISVGFQNLDNDMLTFFVSDTGIGIPPEKQDIIFNRFVQAEQDTSKLYGGSGLGLSIVKGLLKLLGGEIWLESIPGIGSTFYFSIPLKLAQIPVVSNKEENSDKSVVNSGAVILIVEDDYFNAQYLKEILSSLNYKIFHVKSGIEAIELSKKMKIDIVLMDIRLPDISGYDATIQIKKLKPDQVIIAQTAYATSSDKHKALEVGCNDHISKPVMKDLLLSKINTYISK